MRLLAVLDGETLQMPFGSGRPLIASISAHASRSRANAWRRGSSTVGPHAETRHSRPRTTGGSRDRRAAARASSRVAGGYVLRRSRSLAIARRIARHHRRADLGEAGRLAAVAQRHPRRARASVLPGVVRRRGLPARRQHGRRSLQTRTDGARGPGPSEEALARPHTRQFDMTGRPMQGWILVAPDALDR